MSTYRKDHHLGTEVPLIGSDDIGEGVIKTWHLADKCVTMPKLADDVIRYINERALNVQQALQVQIEDIMKMLKSVVESGVVLSQHYGDNEFVGVSQKTLTRTLKAINAKLAEITGDDENMKMGVASTKMRPRCISRQRQTTSSSILKST